MIPDGMLLWHVSQTVYSLASLFLFFSELLVMICSQKSMMMSPIACSHMKVMPFLQYLYDNIKTSPFKVPDDAENSSIAFFNPERDGWLTKEGLRYDVMLHECSY